MGYFRSFVGLIILLKAYLGVFVEITIIDMLVEGYLRIFFGSSIYFYVLHEKSFKTSFSTPNVNISVFFQPMKANPIKIQYWLDKGQSTYKNFSWVILGNFRGTPFFLMAYSMFYEGYSLIRDIPK